VLLEPAFAFDGAACSADKQYGFVLVFYFCFCAAAFWAFIDLLCHFFHSLNFFDERVENVSFSEAEPKFKVNGITFEFQKFGGGRGGI